MKKQFTDFLKDTSYDSLVVAIQNFGLSIDRPNLLHEVKPDLYPVWQEHLKSAMFQKGMKPGQIYSGHTLVYGVLKDVYEILMYEGGFNAERPFPGPHLLDGMGTHEAHAIVNDSWICKEIRL